MTGYFAVFQHAVARERFYVKTEGYMTTILLRKNENFEGALRRFKRAVEKSGKLTDFRRCSRFVKKSAERKRRQAAAVQRLLKKLSREAMQMQQRRDRDR
jgi:small subunit ribosomal protein S21